MNTENDDTDNILLEKSVINMEVINIKSLQDIVINDPNYFIDLNKEKQLSCKGNC